jgi:hypothetical protein
MTRHDDEAIGTMNGEPGSGPTGLEAAVDEKHIPPSTDEKDHSASSLNDMKYDPEKHAVTDMELAAMEDDLARLDNDKVLETAADFSTALVSADDDETMRVNTFRMWFSGVGYAAFGSVLGILFVRF